MPHRTDEFLSTPAAVETVAAVEHERWSHWQRYLHAQCTVLDDGSLLIPADLAARWARQMHTPFAELSEDEKDSDREQAHEYLAALKETAGDSSR